MGTVIKEVLYLVDIDIIYSSMNTSMCVCICHYVHRACTCMCVWATSNIDNLWPHTIQLTVPATDVVYTN